MKLKVGDKVRIKSIDWYNKHKNEYGSVHGIDNSFLIFVDTMAKYCGKVATITEVSKYSYSISIDNEEVMFNWEDWMFEDEQNNKEAMNEELSLCEILKGCEGIELYSPVFGNATLQEIKNNQLHLKFHRRMASDGDVWYDGNGKLYNHIDDTEVTLFPSKEQRDWSLFEKPIPVDTPMMCSEVITCNTNLYSIQFYAGKIEGKHKCYINGFSSKEECASSYWKVMIPFNKFNPSNMEESLKYNIQK